MMLTKEELEQYKHDCILALTCLSYDDKGHYIWGLRHEIDLLKQLIEEHFELIERKNRWKEIAHNLDEALREYQRKYGE